LGLAARFDPAKDHETFFRCAAIVKSRIPTARFLLCGKDVDAANPRILRWVDQLNLRDCCRLLGLRDDIPRILAGLDVLVSSSAHEGFPNVLGEAMSCAVPCVATDAGDSAFVVGDTGSIVPPRNADALAEACLKMIDLGPSRMAQLGAAARLRIETCFSIKAIAAQYQDIYTKAVRPCAA
jgi:glycosyltransferase involved in cell wall biosynthesis